jgi:hypothetical protein
MGQGMQGSGIVTMMLKIICQKYDGAMNKRIGPFEVEICFKVSRPISSETGQSIALIALVFVVLLAFVGLAVDVGFAFVRSSQFSAAVDAASLAAVVDLDPSTDDTIKADLRAEQFLAANGWPTDTISSMTSQRSLTLSGIPQYTLTVTWPVDFTFARILGLDSYDITHPATAAFYALAEIHTTTAAERGHLRKASQFLYGPDSCTQHGDPVSPKESVPGTSNPEYATFNGLYRYRISVTEAYSASNTLRVELFDPDSYNNQDNVASVTHSISDGRPVQSMDCNGTSAGWGDRCVIGTGESLTAINQNSFWFQRVDENWLPDCTQDVANPFGSTVTSFELYYLNDSGDKQPLAMYTVDNNRDYLNSDLKWVSPGAPGSLVPADSGSFEVDLNSVPTDASGLKVIGLDVKAESGSSKNVWDIGAGPPPGYFTGLGLPPLDADVNIRNLQLANSPTLYNTKGFAIYALGRLPTSHYVSGAEIELPLTPLESELGGGTMYATVFDHDPSAPPPGPYFTIDTVSTSDFKMFTEIVDPPTGNHLGTQDDPLESGCNNGTNCDNSWLYPQFAMGVPEQFFFGGTLEANYDPGGSDHVWAVSVSAGRPFLTE